MLVARDPPLSSRLFVPAAAPAVVAVNVAPLAPPLTAPTLMLEDGHLSGVAAIIVVGARSFLAYYADVVAWASLGAVGARHAALAVFLLHFEVAHRQQAAACRRARAREAS